MAMQIGGSRSRAEINITPMIDILLVLLIIFLVITPTKPVGLRSNVPQDSAADAAPPDPATIVIFAKGGGMVEVNHQPVAVDELAAKLLSVFHGRPDSTVFVDGDRSLPFGEIARVIDVTKGAGISRVGLMPGTAR